MTNFIYDDIALPAAKADRASPTIPTQQWSASDANAVFTALDDIRSALQGQALSVTAFGAVGDGVNPDASAIQAAINAAAVTVNGGFGSFVVLPKGTYLCESQLILPNGVGLLGAGPASTVLRAKSTLSATSLVTNQTHNGTQEFAFLQGLLIDGNQAGGASLSTAVVDLVSLFVNSYVRDVIIENGSNVGLHIAAGGTPGGMGPIHVQNTWVINCLGHNVLIEELAGNAGAAMGIRCDTLVSEHQASGKSAIYLKGLGSAAQWNFTNTHVEMGQAGATGQTGITLDGVPDVILSGVQLLTGAAVTAGITITTAAANVRISIDRVSNINLINPVINDLKNSITVGAVNVPWYATPEYVMRGAPRFLPASSTAKSAAFQDSSGTDRTWFNGAGQVTGESFNGAGLDIVADATNNRALTLSDNTGSPRVFGWYFPDASNFRLRYFNGGIDLLNFDNSGNGFIYNPLTIQFLMTLQSALKGPGSHSAAPSSGTHVQGEVIFNADPVAAGFIGWVCVTAGSPGTWKSWGAISA